MIDYRIFSLMNKTSLAPRRILNHHQPPSTDEGVACEDWHHYDGMFV